MTTRNTYWRHKRKHSVVLLTFIPHWSLEIKLVTFCCYFSGIPVMPWHTMTQSHAQMVWGVQTVPVPVI